MDQHRFPYRWTLKDEVFTKDKGKVFSCFACGGGSTMGYKLAGFDVIGCNEIDPRMNKVYVANHHPRFNFLEGIQTFKHRKDLPKELYQLDILDGSPPCFVAGTMVATDNGDVPIEKVNVGDMVLTSDGFRRVTNFFDNGTHNTYKTRIEYIVDDKVFHISFEATTNHKIKTARGWVELEELTCSDKIYVLDPTNSTENHILVESQIATIIKVESHSHVYDIEVEDKHEFFAEGLLVHNCSSFSTAGSREDGWGKEKKFREGQAKQVLDTLFFDFIDLAKELQPKVVIAENVKGLTLGAAKAYMARIYQEFDEAGYAVTYELLDASVMGVPQLRERVFFLAIRKDLMQYIPTTSTLFEELPMIDLRFNEPQITMEGIVDYKGRRWDTSTKTHQLWLKRREGDRDLGDINLRENGSQAFFSNKLIYPNEVCLTLTAAEDTKLHFHEPCFFSDQENSSVSTFPQDYDYLQEKSSYICGMSVPPVMMAQVASRVWEQWLSKIPL